MEIIFATHNRHKLLEAVAIAGASCVVSGLDAIGCFEEIPETANTLYGNSQQKATYVYQKYGVNCFADDTGLEIDALNGRPGVFSARYAGPQCNARDNLLKVMEEMKNQTVRTARFKTVITLIINGQTYQFEGKVEGEIITQERGGAGFGYDPIFCPNGYPCTFSEMSEHEKNAVSHRGQALRKMFHFLRTSYLPSHTKNNV